MSKLAHALTLAFLLLGCTALFAQEFSADMIDTREGKPANSGKIFVGKTKIRFESNREEHGSGIVIFDQASQHFDVLIPERHIYMEMGQEQKTPALSRASAFFRFSNVDNACPERQKATEDAGNPLTTCHKVGEETVNGRAAIKYAGTSSEGDEGFAWIDRSLRFVIKWQGKNDTMELRNIQEASQPASLFEIPSDYQKFDMNMMRGMRPQGAPQR